MTSALPGIEWSALRPGRFTPEKIIPGTNLVGGWEAPESVWTLWRREKLATAWCLTLTLQLAARLYTD
jgi:hypothetical protein